MESKPLATVYVYDETQTKEKKLELQKLKPLPPGYQGCPWTNKLLHALSAAELHRLIQLYGANQINAAVAANAAKGVK